MAAKMEPFPTVEMIFYVTQDANDSIRNAVRGMIEHLSISGEWLLGPPEFIDVVEAPDNGKSDLPIETVGGLLRICSALPPTSLPRDIDAIHYHEVVATIESVRALSELKNLTFEFELGGT